MEEPAVPVRPVHHGGNREAAIQHAPEIARDTQKRERCSRNPCYERSATAAET
jgi:hypothetical protein